MKTALPILAALLLAACATGPRPEASVVSFHSGQPMTRGTIAVVPTNPADAQSLAFRVHAESVAVELRRQGFTTVADPKAAQYIAIISIDQQSRASQPRNSGLTIGVGGGFSSGNVGIGSSVQVPVGGQQQAGGITATTLNVRINTSATGAPVWEGRATKDAVVNTPAADTTNAVPYLATALFRDFPGTSGRTQVVRL